MPEYLVPGAYVQETPLRAEPIEGVSTSTTGFVGPTRYGPTRLVPSLVTSLGEFERIYGDGQPLQYNDQSMTNYVWQGVRAFFEEGGKRLYVARVFRGREVAPHALTTVKGWVLPLCDPNTGQITRYVDEGTAYFRLPAAATAESQALHFRARFPGSLGNLCIRLTLTLGQNLLGADEEHNPIAPVLQPYDTVWLGDLGNPLSSPPGPAGAFYQARPEPDPATLAPAWGFYDQAGQKAFALMDFHPNVNPDTGDQLRVVTLTITVLPTHPSGVPRVWANLPLDPRHRLAGTTAVDSLFDAFAEQPANSALEHSLPIVVWRDQNLDSGIKVLQVLLDAAPAVTLPDGGTSSLDAELRNLTSTDTQRSFDIILAGGHDGSRPGATEYAGEDHPTQNFETGLKVLEDLDDISIVAAPGSTFGYDDTSAAGYHADATAIINLLISHATKMRYRIAVLDSGDGETPAQVRALRSTIDSKYGALYYPWVRVLDPVSRREIFLPPSGFVCGIYARNDISRGVYQAPSNQVVNLALGFEILLNKSQQDNLNAGGINCLRFFEKRGFRLWGARTISSDPEWKYVNLRRYFAYLEHSIDKGTQWAVFEANGETLWANVRRAIENFLLNEWQRGALLGDKPESAYFVRCDRSTMTQDDLDNGRLVCLIGVALLRPAEFVIFRIGQSTADAAHRPRVGIPPDS